MCVRVPLAPSSSGFTIVQIGGIIDPCPLSPAAAIAISRRNAGASIYGDVRAGTIMQCVGNPGAAPKWQWRCGFYPGSRPSECTNGTAETFQAAREAFEAAWRIFLARRTEADFQAWRDQQVWTAEKYRRFDRGERMAADWTPT
jgi:hypothetical protein